MCWQLTIVNTQRTAYCHHHNVVSWFLLPFAAKGKSWKQIKKTTFSFDRHCWGEKNTTYDCHTTHSLPNASFLQRMQKRVGDYAFSSNRLDESWKSCMLWIGLGWLVFSCVHLCSLNMFTCVCKWIGVSARAYIQCTMYISDGSARKERVWGSKDFVRGFVVPYRVCLLQTIQPPEHIKD